MFDKQLIFMKILFILLFCFAIAPTVSFAQKKSTAAKWTVLKNGAGSERVEVAKELSSYYQSESLDSMRIIGEILFFYGIDERYQPGIEYGKTILSEYYILHGRVNDGIGMAKDLIAPLQERGEYERLSEIYRIIASGYRKLGDGTSTLLWAEKALEVNKNIKNNPEPFTGYPMLAEAYLLKNKKSKAIEIYSKYILEVSKVKNYRRLSSAYARLGDIYRLNQDLVNAEKYFKLSYTAALNTNLTSPKTHALNNLAIIYFEKNDTETAKDYFIQAMTLREKIGDVKSITESYFNMGEYFFYTENYPDALTWYERSATLAKKEQLLKEEKDGVIGMANTYKALGDFEDATFMLEKALEISNQLEALQIKDEEELTNLQQEVWKAKNNEIYSSKETASSNYWLVILAGLCLFFCGLSVVLWLKAKKHTA